MRLAQFYVMRVRSKALVLALHLFLTGTVVAWGEPSAHGHGGGLVASGQTPGFVGTYFSGSATCSPCHDGLADNRGNDISIVRNWSGSTMANSTRDPYWRAKVASELHRNPQISDELNNKCSRCHAPMANESLRKDGESIEILSPGFLDPNNPYFQHAIDGVSCTLCHQIADDGNLGSLEATSGEFTTEFQSSSRDRPAYGQYLDPFAQPMRMFVGFTPQFGSHTGTSELCASCHDLKTAFVDAEGNLASTTLESEFPEQMVYSEWAHSAYRVGGTKERSCQSCHMPKVRGLVPIASHHMARARPDFARHRFVGANTMMLSILDENRDELGVTSQELAKQVARTRRFLTKRSAALKVLSAEVVEGSLTVRLRVRNRSGHKLPTGYPSRRVYIHFVVHDGGGNVVFESGKLNSDGSIVGVSLDSDSTRYEPHYDLIERTDQVQVYEPIMADTDGGVTHTLARAAFYVKDNRLLPAGFDKLAAPPDIQVAGAAAQDPNFRGRGDIVTYLVDVGEAESLTVSAGLNYQALSYGHLQDLFLDASLPEVARFRSQFQNASIRIETLARVATVVRRVASPVGKTESNP